MRPAHQVFVCRNCGARIASEADVVSISGRPARTRHDNPLGETCEIITFLDARGLEGAEFSTEEHTWFEGYAWRPVCCGNCRRHLGWRYEAAAGGLDPAAFYGLLVPAIAKVRDD